MARPRSDINERILRAAAVRFLHDGVDGASLRQIALEAGTSVGMVSYYFPTKDDLFVAVVEDKYRAVLRDITAAFAPDDTFEAQTQRLYQRIAALDEDEFRVVRMVLREALVASPRMPALLARFSEGHVPVVLRAVMRALAAGELRSDLPPPAAAVATIALGVLPQLLVRLVGPSLPAGVEAPPPAVAAVMHGVLLHGVAARRSVARSALMWKRCTRCDGRYRTPAVRCPLDGAALVDHHDPLIGRVIAARYRLLERIGAGAMGSVYRAAHETVGREFAVKVLDPALARDAMQRRRFVGEAQAANLLKHPNIVVIYDCGADGDDLYLVMDLLRGESLDTRLQRAPMPLGESLAIAAGVARALAHAHDAGVVHRDIKPANVFLCEQAPRVKVLDLGVAHVRRDEQLTATGQVLGTPGYLSPEQARGEPISAASDLYALGVMLFKMITRRLPFEGTAAQMVIAHAQRPAPKLRALDPNVPDAVEALVDRLLAKDPRARHTDARAAAADLEAALVALPPGAAPDPSHRPTGASIEAWRARRAVFGEGLRAAYGEVLPAEASELVARLDAALARERPEDIARAAESLTAHLSAFPAARRMLFEETAATRVLD